MDESFLEEIKSIIYKYKSEIPNGLEFYYKDVLAGINDEAMANMFNMSIEDLRKYAMVCKIIADYNDVCEGLAIIDDENVDPDEKQEYQETVDELTDAVRMQVGVIRDLENEEKESDVIDASVNLIIYAKHIDDSMNRTRSSRNGRGDEAQKKVANLIRLLRDSDYQSLRKKGLMHQVKTSVGNDECYIEKNAFERIGGRTTKVNFIRVPISEKNRETIKQYTRSDFDTLFLIISFGDFKNEQISEKKFYSMVYSDMEKNKDAIVEIINLFKNDFTDQTLSIAMEIINNGFVITEELLSIILDSHLQ